MEGGGAAGVHIDYDDDEDEKELANMTEEQIEILNANFAAIYARDPELQSYLKGNVDKLTLLQKYQVLVHY